MQDKSAMELPCYTCQNANNSTGANQALHSVAIIRFSKCKVLKVLAQALVFALFIMMLPWLGANFQQLYRKSSSRNDLMRTEFGLDVTDLATLPLLFRDLANEGLIKKGDKALIVGNTGEESPSDALYSSVISSTGDVKLIPHLDSEHQSSIPDEAFEFAFTSGFHTDAEFIDRTLKLGGIAAIQIGKNPSLEFRKPWNFKFVYLRRLSSTFIAMRKIAYSEIRSPMQRKLLKFTPEEKKAAALWRLEDVLLEPPRAASGKSRTYSKRTKFLPDLLDDSLENYPRRVYIDVGLAGKDSTEWFEKNYPTRNQYFEKYRIETVPDTEMEMEELPASEGMSDWMRMNMKEEEFVVMKAEVDVVEEMVKSKAIELVDELFMECKPRGKGTDRKSRRAYWECLALYGRLRDLGVAVHQWWG
ncbi:hypothetical protein Ancab_036506 [Ancistrocladus abbreviatus]